MRHRRTLAAVAAVALLVLTGCTGDDTTDAGSESPSPDAGAATEQAPDPSATGEPEFTYGDPDVTFLQQMAASHDQALGIARQVAERSEQEDFRQLASDTIEFRERQLQLIADLAEDAEVTVDAADHATGGEAVVPDDEVAGLEQAEGSDFDIAAAELLARIDEGAVALADATLEGAEHPEVVVAAIDTIDHVEPQAETLRTWIADWGG